MSKYENGERRIDVVEFLEICKLLKAGYVSILKEIENTNQSIISKKYYYNDLD